MTRRRRSRDVMALLHEVESWEPFIGPTGVQLYKIPAGEGTGTYTVCAASCTCPADQYARRGQVCKHRTALALATMIHQTLSKGAQAGMVPERQRAGSPTPAPDPERATQLVGAGPAR